MWPASRVCSSSYRDLGSPNSVKRRFVRHLTTSPRCLASIVSLLLSKPSTTRDFSLEVDAFDLIQSDPVLGNMLLRFPATLLPLLEESIVDAQKEVLRGLERIHHRQNKQQQDDDDDEEEEESARLNANGNNNNKDTGLSLPSVMIKGERHVEEEEEAGRHHPRTTTTRVHARLIHLPPHLSCCKPSLSSINAGDVGKVVQISGTVVRASAVQMHEYTRPYRCLNKNCGHIFRVFADLEQLNNALPSPTICPNMNMDGTRGNGNNACRGTKFEIVHGESEHTDYQEIKLQESASRLSVGRIPRSILVKLQHDLVDSCQPGDDVVVVGSLISLWRPVSGILDDCDITMALRAHSIRVANGGDNDHASWKGMTDDSVDGSGSAVKDELRREFDEFWNQSAAKERPIAARNFICKAVCPKLYGLYVIKLALLLTLIGGVSESKVHHSHDADYGRHENARRRRLRDENDRCSNNDDDDEPEQFRLDHAELSTEPDACALSSCSYADKSSVGGMKWRGRRESVYTRRRDQSHLLLVGDPGTGKSQFLRFAAALCPRSVLTTGVGTTSAGLTCAAVREGNSKEFTLEAGALVLADKGVCCIDEFGCIRDEDRTTIHEAMEQQTLSVAKAGIVCKLNCRATIIAVTNPKGGLYDDQETLSKNTGIGPPLLSRFDLIFKLVDSSDSNRDDNIADYLLNRAIQGSGYECTKHADLEGVYWNMAKLRGYIATIKDRFLPTVSDDAALLLRRHYEKCREVENSTIKTTVRFFESMIRLSQAHARLMYRDVVLLEDAVAVILIMECSASKCGGFNPSFGGSGDYDGLILTRDPMSLPFPDDDKADWEFLCDEYLVLDRYRMLDRLSAEQRERAELSFRWNGRPMNDCFDSSSVSSVRNLDSWNGVEDARDRNFTANCSQTNMAPMNESQSSNGQSYVSYMVEEKDHYGRSHLSPRFRPSPQRQQPAVKRGTTAVSSLHNHVEQSEHHSWERGDAQTDRSESIADTRVFPRHLDPDAQFVADLERRASQKNNMERENSPPSSQYGNDSIVSRDIHGERSADSSGGEHTKKKRKRRPD